MSWLFNDIKDMKGYDIYSPAANNAFAQVRNFKVNYIGLRNTTVSGIWENFYVNYVDNRGVKLPNNDGKPIPVVKYFDDKAPKFAYNKHRK